MQQQQSLTVSIIIKAYNEERHIAAAIESALAALDGLDGEVILADGASSDRTLAIAQRYPIKIVRLDNQQDRSCGAGAQLGYQYSKGKYLCLIDGDMRLHPGFLAAGVSFLDNHPTVGGVGGTVTDCGPGNLEYQQRAWRFDPDRSPGPVRRLYSSGLYRRSAIEGIGYVTDRNLHGGEELELASRLRARGWTLERIDCPAVEHYVNAGNAYWLLLRRIKSGNAWGPGELMRASIGQPQFRFVVRDDRNSLLCGLVVLWWSALAALALFGRSPAALAAFAAIGVLPFAVMAGRWRSLRSGLYSVAVWNAQALCFLPGFLRRRKPPAHWMPSTVIKDGPVGAAGPSVRAPLGILADNGGRPRYGFGGNA